MTTRTYPGRIPKESQFVVKHGSRLHAFHVEKAPYPASYNRDVLDLEAIDLSLLKYARGSVSFVDFDGEKPTRVLDLGCGSGAWVIEAAKEWPKCHFVGYDLVNVQVNTQLLEHSMASRIEWVHGNFLTSKLPFSDDEFDHVHIHGIARGVPESKWDVLFQEVNRVLRTGGAVEISEEDAIFPVLPRWFTSPLRARLHRTASIHFPNGLVHSRSSNADSRQHESPHDHDLLESLFKSVFESRFINMTPTALLPSYFQTYFRQTTVGPPIPFSMSPPPEVKPLTEASFASDMAQDEGDTALTFPRSSSPEPASVPMSRPASDSPASTSSLTLSDTSLSLRNRRRASTSLYTLSGSYGSTMGSENNVSPMQRFCMDVALANAHGNRLKPYIEKMMSMRERALAMHVYHSYQSVLACQEAMWEELKDRVLNKKSGLKAFGWDDDEELSELQSRSKFELLIARFKSDMHSWVCLWSSLTSFGWTFPAREPLNKAEIMEEERIRENMLHARMMPLDDLQYPCRTLRVLTGYKEEVVTY